MLRRTHHARSPIRSRALLISISSMLVVATSMVAPVSAAPGQPQPSNRCLTTEPTVESLASTEAASIHRLYCAFFLRPPRPDGLQYWLGVSRSSSVSGIASTFASGAEFQNRYGPLSDSGFVDLVFTNVMGRPAADGGRAYWVDRLSNGMSRGSLMLNFSDSGEFKRRTGTNLASTDGPDMTDNDVNYANCTAVRDAGAAPIRRGEPGYAPHLDRDGDGIACEL